jgi:hypothetical protein
MALTALSSPGYTARASCWSTCRCPRGEAVGRTGRTEGERGASDGADLARPAHAHAWPALALSLRRSRFTPAPDPSHSPCFHGLTWLPLTPRPPALCAVARRPIMFVNEAWERATGIPKDSLSESHFWSAFQVRLPRTPPRPATPLRCASRSRTPASQRQAARPCRPARARTRCARAGLRGGSLSPGGAAGPAQSASLPLTAPFSPQHRWQAACMPGTWPATRRLHDLPASLTYLPRTNRSRVPCRPCA